MTLGVLGEDSTVELQSGGGKSWPIMTEKEFSCDTHQLIQKYIIRV